MELSIIDLSALLSSSVVGGLVAGLVALRSSERKIQIENVTQERAKWREKIRRMSCDVHQAAVEGDKAKLSALQLEFAINLNPFDEEDEDILCVIDTLATQDSHDATLGEFAERIALLLKHDWQRAKYEAKPWFFRCSEPVRTPHDQFKDNKSRKIYNSRNFTS